MPPDASSDTNPHRDVAAIGADLVDLDVTALAEAAPQREFDCAGWTDQQLMSAEPLLRNAAFAELFDRHAASITSTTRMLLGTAHSGCEDVVAEVFVALWRAPEKFDASRGSLLGYLRMQARGRSIDLLRSETSRQRREQRIGRDVEPSSAIDTELIRTEAGEDLRQAVSLLPGGERIAIELAYFGGMTYRAVALELGIPEGTAKSRIRNGLARLRAVVAVDETGVDA